MKYDFYYSEKQARHFGDVNNFGGVYDYLTRERNLIMVNTINDRPYTICAEHGKPHGCEWGNVVLIATEDLNKAKFGLYPWFNYAIGE